MQQVSHIIKGIYMTVQRGNAASIMSTHGPQRKVEKCFDVILQDETNCDTYSKVITSCHSTNLINKIVLDQLIKDLRHHSMNQNLFLSPSTK